MVRRHRAGPTGFTLTELAIAIAVAAILAVVAFPSYQEQVRKSRRWDAVVALRALANRLEIRRSDLGTYPADATEVSAFLPSASASSPQGYYTLSVEGLGTHSTATKFKIRASRKSPGLQAGDTRCGDYTLTDQEVRGITGTGTLAECWQTP